MKNHYLLAGGPGSGKTSTLVGRIAKAVGESMYGGDILICSLTRTAAHEIAERVKARVPGVEFPHVGTVHALALRALKQDGVNVKLVYEREHVRDFNREYGKHLPESLGNTMYDPEAANADLKTLASVDRRMAAEQPIEEWPHNVASFYTVWSQWKSMRGLMDFTDLIRKAIEVCGQHPADLKYIFVDEAQDLSALEMRLIKQWARSTHKTIVAGDDQQALYEWRGANVAEFIEFAPKENQYILPRSYRMPEAVYAQAKRFGDRIRLKIDKEFSPVGDGGIVQHKLVNYMLDGVLADLKEYESVMLLATCGYMLNPTLKELRSKGVPYHNPYRSRADGKTWNPLRSHYAEAYRCFLMPSEGQHMWTWPQLGRVLRYLKDVPGDLRDLVTENKLSKSTVPGSVVDRHRLDGLLDAARTGDYHAFFDLLDTKYKFGHHGSVSSMGYVKRVLDSHGRASLDEAPGLIVGTVHSVKGGEADSVYVLPMVSPEAHRNMGRNMDSLLRTFYVGVSRAKKKLTLVDCPNERRKMW